MGDEQRFNQLLERYLADKITSDEYRELMHLIKSGAYDQTLKDKVERSLFQDQDDIQLEPLRANEIRYKILNAERNNARIVPLKPKRYNFLRIAAAASVIGLILLGVFYFNKSEKNEVVKTEVRKNGYKNDVLPGGDKAVLTLADGSTIVLDNAQNGALTQQGTTKVIKLNGKLAYDPAGTNTKKVLYNTLSTPRGGQYQVELADGTQVWLNAASSLHFPTAFAGKERRVEITGEAYFEVAKNKAMPFIVRVGGAEVKVLGTHFNVMAYSGEPAVKTTLLEGSVQFVSGSNTSLLRPGQQSQLLKEGQVKVISDVDAGDVIAWKDGLFHFENADIETVMRQLSRWYDVEVVFKSHPTDNLFYAKIPRNSKLSDILKVLEITGNLRFDIEGKKIIVL